MEIQGLFLSCSIEQRVQKKPKPKQKNTETKQKPQNKKQPNQTNTQKNPKELGYQGYHQTQYKQTMCAFSPASQVYIGLHQKRGGQQGKGVVCPPLFCPHEAPTCTTVSSPGALSTRCGVIGVGPVECHKDNKMVGASLL